MLNEEFQKWDRPIFGSHHSIRNHMHTPIDLSGVIWADSTGYVGNLFLLWLALVMDDGAWNLVSSDIPEVDAQIHNISWGE